jgi:rod shape-determining protein MreD
MIKSFGKYIIRFVILVLLQVLVFNNIQLSGFIIPCYYVLFILLLPFETPKWSLPLIGFLLGLSIDLFTHTPGIHASATVLMAFSRPFVLNMIAPREGYEPGSYPTLYYYGLEWFLKYSAILVCIHHFFLFYVEIFRISDFFATFLRALLSSAFSILFIVLSQYFIFKRS